MVRNIYKSSDTKITNQNFELYKENGEYYLKIDFDYENEYGFYKGRANKVKFNLLLNSIECKRLGSSQWAQAEFLVPMEDSCDRCLLDIGIDDENNLFTIELVKEKVHEMTVEEIEHKLGHKIKVVSKSE